ncbi:MAG: ribosome small subunit-dependent GTPase A [Actinobacteria bacterium]|nr:ribosome small subunit-dependent GTPase A [Actinomycetota bacterium]
MLDGRVIRSHGQIYYVLVGERLLECRQRGRFRLEKRRVLAGDRVKVTPLGKDSGVIEEILPRVTALTRPPVANVDQAVVVFTARSPELNLPLLDRFLVLVEAAGLDVVLCLNKVDLLEPGRADAVLGPYRAVGYRAVGTSALTGEGVDDLRPLLSGKVSVLAGQSGVGKSRLLNALVPGADLRTGELSSIQRGTHTTRHVELLEVGSGETGGLVADSPGFSFLELNHIEKGELASLFPEMRELGPDCRFSGCLHYQEPDCVVKEAVEEGRIAAARYEHYRQFLAEILERPPRY